MSSKLFVKLAMMVTIAILSLTGFAQQTPPGRMTSAAILSFSERGKGVQDLGSQAGDLIFAKMSEECPEIMLVERQEIKKILSELHLNATNMVSPDTANKIGKLTGAQILITGSIFKIRNKTYLVAKIIGVETGQVLGASVSGVDQADVLSENLAAKIAKILATKTSRLLPKEIKKTDIIAMLKKKIAGKKLPSLYIRIPEKNYTQPTIDPAAETELKFICRKLGFKVLDSRNKAQIRITGEAFSETTPAIGKFFCARGRVEVKAVENDNTIAVDRQTTVAADIVQRTAGKTALQKAGLKIAIRLIPQLVK
jgi:Curli production assembly/transport component CsgG